MWIETISLPGVEQRLVDGDEVADRGLRGGRAALRGAQPLVEGGVVGDLRLALLLAVDRDVEADRLDPPLGDQRARAGRPVVSQTTAVWALEFNAAILADAAPTGCRRHPATLSEVTRYAQRSDHPHRQGRREDRRAAWRRRPRASEQALRVAVRGGGCSGFQYALAFDKPKDDDNVFEVDGVAVVVDKVSMQFVFGSEVDYVEGLQGAGFQVNNPNVVAACGCGSSFQVKEDADAAV